MTERAVRPPNLPPAPDALWDWMEKMGYTQREAANVLEFPYPTFHHYLHAYRKPLLPRLDRIYRVTGIPPLLWLETRVAKSKKSRSANSEKRQYFPNGNARAS